MGERAAKSILGEDIEAARLGLAHGRFAGHQQKSGQEKTRSIATINRYLATFKSALLMAIANDKVERSPFRKVKLQKENNARVRFLTEDEQARLLRAIPKTWHGLVLIALHTGLRFSEQMGLRWEDIDFRQRVHYCSGFQGGQARHIPLNRISLETLESVPQRINCPGSSIPKTEGREPQLPRQWEAWIAEAEIENFHWHDFAIPLPADW